MKHKALCYLAKLIIVLTWLVLALVVGLGLLILVVVVGPVIQKHSWSEIAWAVGKFSAMVIVIPALITASAWAFWHNEKC